MAYRFKKWAVPTALNLNRYFFPGLISGVTNWVEPTAIFYNVALALQVQALIASEKKVRLFIKNANFNIKWNEIYINFGSVSSQQQINSRIENVFYADFIYVSWTQGRPVPSSKMATHLRPCKAGLHSVIPLNSHLELLKKCEQRII